MTQRRWRRALLGRVVSLAQRGTPRLETAYARLPDSAGLAPGLTPQEHEQALLRYYAELRDRVAELPPPNVRVSLLLAGAELPGAAATMASVGLQLSPDWELVVSLPPGTATPEAVRALADRCPGRVRAAPAAETPADRLVAAYTVATGDYVTVVRAGDRLYPSALAELRRALFLTEQTDGSAPDLLYSDERRIDESGTPIGDPLHKPGWSPLLLRAGGDYLGSLSVFRRSAAAEAGGLRAEPDPAHALALRLAATGARVSHVPHVLVQTREPAAPAKVHPAPPPLPDPAPVATVVIPTRDQPDLIRACLHSVLTATDYPDLRIVVVDNGTTDPAARAVLQQAEADPRISVLSRPGAFNFARLCNAGAQLADPDGVVVLLNNDTEVISPGWLRALVGAALLPEIGAAGAQLRYPDGTIQHAGLAGLADAGTGHLFVARDPARESPLQLADSLREVLAVTGACLAVRTDAYRAVGGLDEVFVPNDSGDVDLCLRLRAKGLVSVYVPQAVLLHREQHTRGRSFRDFERFYLRRRWPAELLNDPYLNPHLARSTKYVPDARFGLPDVPVELFDRWLATGSLGLSAPQI